MSILQKMRSLGLRASASVPSYHLDPAILSAIDAAVGDVEELDILIDELTQGCDQQPGAAVPFADQLNSIRDDLAELLLSLEVCYGYELQPIWAIRLRVHVRAFDGKLRSIEKRLSAIHEHITGNWSVQPISARSVKAGMARQSQQYIHLEPYAKAAVDALLSQFGEEYDGVMATAYLGLATRLLYDPLSSLNKRPATSIASSPGTHEQAKRTAVHNKILQHLQYSSMDTRRRNVVVDQPAFTSIARSSLSHWLESECGIFLIVGKEGSGKSTLMRYIDESKETRSHLRLWESQSEGHELIYLSFFFWRNGTRLDRSAEGLWRALIWQVLDKLSELCPSVFPKLWATLYATLGSPLMDAWTVMELHDAFERLITQVQKPLKIAILIDGLDEHDQTSNDSDVLGSMDFIKTKLAVMPNVKIIMSSRPLEDLERLDLTPNIVLHDQNRDDIQSYVEQHLTLLPTIDGQINNFHGQAVQNAIMQAADGVFLSSVLLTRYVESQLVQGCTPAEIIVLLSDPQCHDIRHQYKLIWDDLDTNTQEHAGNIMSFLMVNNGLSLNMQGEEQVVRLIDLTLALEKVRRTLPTTMIPWHILESRIERSCIAVARGFMEKWPGFITISNNSSNESGAINSASQIAYCHRSVPDFFIDLFRERSPGGFNPRVAHLQTMLHQLKILPQPYPREPLRIMWSFASAALVAAHMAERMGDNSNDLPLLLKELDKTMQTHHRKLQEASRGAFVRSTFRDHREIVTLNDHGVYARRQAKMHWSNFHCDDRSAHPVGWQDCFLSLAVHYGLYDYIWHQLLGGRDRLINKVSSFPKKGRPLLMYALAPHLPLATIEPYDLVSVKIVDLIIRYGGKPNERYERATCWQAGIQWLHNLLTVRGGQDVSSAGGTSEDIKALAESRANICLLLLEAGADPLAWVNLPSTGIPLFWTGRQTDRLKPLTRKVQVREALEIIFKPWIPELLLQDLLSKLDENTKALKNRRSYKLARKLSVNKNID